MSEEIKQIETCRNCGVEIQGKFCHNCGQKIQDFNKSFGVILKELIAENFSFDTRFFRTLFPLLFKPGSLTKDYFEGRRKRYIPVFQLFFSICFFLFLSIAITNKAEDVISKGENKSDQAITDTIKKHEADIEAINDTITKALNNARVDTLKKEPNVNINILGKEGKGIVLNAASGNKEAIADSLKPQLLEFLGNNWFGRTMTYGIVKTIKRPEKFQDDFWDVLSQVIFLLLPVFAITMKFLYLRKRILFIHHFIFSVHFHSFALIILTIIIFISNYQAFLFLLIPLYLFIGMKKYYQQGWFTTLFKFIIVTFVHNIVLLFFALFVIGLTVMFI